MSTSIDLWSWRVALIHEYVELFHGVNVPLCSDWTFATRIVVIRAIVATSENSVTSYSMQSRAGRTWCIRSKNSTDISQQSACADISYPQVSYWNTCVQSWICSWSIESLADWKLVRDSTVSVSTGCHETPEINVSWQSSSGAGRSSVRTRGPYRDRTVTACFIDALIAGNPEAHGLRNECDDRVRYVKRRHLEVKYLRLQQLNYTEHLRIVNDKESEILSRKETKFRIDRDAVRTDHLEITQLTKLSCLGTPLWPHILQIVVERKVLLLSDRRVRFFSVSDIRTSTDRSLSCIESVETKKRAANARPIMFDSWYEQRLGNPIKRRQEFKDLQFRHDNESNSSSADEYEVQNERRERHVLDEGDLLSLACCAGVDESTSPFYFVSMTEQIRKRHPPLDIQIWLEISVSFVTTPEFLFCSALIMNCVCWKWRKWYHTALIIDIIYIYIYIIWIL